MKEESTYTDGFLLPLRKENLESYRRTARACAAVWREHGALDYVEMVIDHDGIADMRSFAAAADAGENEIVILAYAVFPSKEVRDEANARIMSDPRIKEVEKEVSELFDCGRMAYGGFRTLVRA